MTAPGEIDIEELERGLAEDDGSAARSHLAAGRPIYYGDDRWPKEVVRKYPDGRMELVEVLGKTQSIYACDAVKIVVPHEQNN